MFKKIGNRALGSTMIGGIALAVVGLVPTVHADDAPSAAPTFSKDVAPIFYSKCVSCHRPGEAAPMSLMSYADSRPWVKSIKKSVVSQEMPPWDADPNCGKWANDLSLSEAQIATIAKWADSGAPEGNPADAPKPPEFTDGWQLGKPDYIIELPEVDVPATGNDYFPNLNLSLEVPEARWVRAVEVRPGNRDVLHHIVLFTAGISMGSASGTFDALAVWAVGTGPVVYPEGSGRTVRPKMNLTANMHYHPNGTPQKDKTQVALYFGQGEMKKEISSALAGELNLRIPANDPNYVLKSTYYVNQDVEVVSIFPHMHMRGKQMTFVAKFPDGTERKLLDVPKYDFNWQWFYYPQEKIILPADTEVEITGIYDNSSGNPNNPDPNHSPTFGEQSTDEMMFGFLEMVPVEGTKLKPVSADKRLAKLTAKLPKEDVYQISSNMGMMSFKTSMHLPKEGGRGTWFLVFGGMVMPIKLENLKWQGNEYTFTMEFLGGRVGTLHAKGTVDDQGNLTGEFKMDQKFEERMEEFARNGGDESGGRRGGGGMGGMFRDFKGVRSSNQAG